MDATRRNLLKSLGSVTAAMALPGASIAHSGAIDASSHGLNPASNNDQSKILQQILSMASQQRKPVFLEPGRYRVSNITLPEYTNIQGVEGASWLDYAGGNHFVNGENCQMVHLSGLSLDGGLQPLAEHSIAALRIASAGELVVNRCHVTNSAGSGMEISGSHGSLTENQIDSCVGYAGILAEDNLSMKIVGNTVEDCANGGILVHRNRRGEDNSIVSGNQIRRISAVLGGTGQWGNGINTYLADNVIVNGNHVSDCAFSAIRSNSCSNIQISDNTALRSGETALYSEFSFEGAKITNNIVDGGATGISISNFNEGGRMSVCSGNLVRNMTGGLPYQDTSHIHGVGISIEADTVVNGNIVETTTNFGLLCGWGPYLRNVIVTSNVISSTRTGVYVSVVEGIGAVNISDNIFSGISEHAIAGYRWQERVTGDLLDSRTLPPAQVKISGNQMS